MAKTSKPSLAETHPELAAQADGWDPHSPGSSAGRNPRSWICDKGHRWMARLPDRIRGNSCPYCSGRYAIRGLNDLATLNANLAAEAEGWDPTTVKIRSNKKVSWRCPLGHLYIASIDKRTTGSGCPICDGKIVLSGFNDLATTNPDLAAEADGWDPTTVTKSSSKSTFQWKCHYGHSWKTTPASRTNGRGCPICANKKVLAGFNDLATTNPDLAAEADGWDPTTVTHSVRRYENWKCELGHQYSAAIYARKAGSGCPICANKKVLAGFNDLATTNPDLAAEADGWDPTTVTQGSDEKVKWKCKEGHVYSSTLANRTGGKGCPTCAKFGFDPNQSGFLYLIDHFDLHMFQIGITNIPEDRLGRHARRGWEVIELRGPMDGHLAQQLETSCLHSLEKRGAILGHKAGIDKFDGYTEAWTKASLNVTSIKQILDWVYEDESK
jgi:hypothetical protein